MDLPGYSEVLPHLASSTGSSVFSRQTQTDFFDSSALPSIANTSDHPLQQADWVSVNNQLRQLGFDPVSLSHSNKLKDNSAAGFAILDHFQATTLRNTIESLLGENLQRQELVKQLLESQNRLQKDHEGETQKSDSYKAELLSYKALFETERIKCQEMERAKKQELEGHSERVRQLEEANSEMFLTSKYLEKENKDMELLLIKNGIPFKTEDRVPLSTSDTNASPENNKFKEGKNKKKHRIKLRKEKLLETYQTKLDNMQKEFDTLRLKVATGGSPETSQASPEDERSDTSSSMSVEIPKAESKTPNGISQMLSPSYQGPLVSSVPRSPAADDRSVVSTVSTEISDASFLFKRLRLTEKKLKEAKRAMKDYEKDIKSLKKDLGNRPRIEEFQHLIVKCRQMEKIISDNNLSLKLANPSDNIEKSMQACTHVGNIDFLPIDICREHLKNVSTQLKVNNILDIPSRVEELRRMDELTKKTLQILKNIDRITRTEEDQIEYHKLIEEREAFFNVNAQNLLVTITAWKKELANLKSVRKSLLTLSKVVVPWKQTRPSRGNEKEVTVSGQTENIIAFIEQLISDCEFGPIKHKLGKPTEKQMLPVIEHFMKLFDVETFSGVFARMNDLYVKYSEMVNIFRTVRELLELESNCGLASIVNAIGKLAKAKEILHVEDLDSVIRNLKNYDNFYLAFTSVINELLATLGVSEVDEIVPAVRALIRYP